MSLSEDRIRFSSSGTQAVRILWCDVSGVRRCRVVPSTKFDGAKQNGVGLTQACMAMPVFSDTVAPNSGLAPVGEVRLMPDTQTLAPLPWYPTHKVALGELHIHPGEPWHCDPRTALKTVLALFQDLHDISLQVGFETEFVLLDPRTLGKGALPMTPVDASVYCQSSAVDAYAYVLDDIVVTLEAMGIGVIQYHAESAHGQFEIATVPFDPLAAADKLLLTREAIVGVARKHNLAVTFLPKYHPHQAGNGCHCHMSLWKDGQNILYEDPSKARAGDYQPLGQEGARFLAGILDHLPGLLTFTAPSATSYKRLAPSTWSGCYRIWGYENREAPLRISCPPGSDVNIEYKAFDAATNPYIGLAAILVAGHLGLVHHKNSPAPLPEPCQVDPKVLTDAELMAAGIVRLPATLMEAMQALIMDEVLKGALVNGLSMQLVQAFLAVRKMEAEHGCENIEQFYLRY